MIALRTVIHVITDEPVDRDTRRAAARRDPKADRQHHPARHPVRPLGPGGASSARSVASSAPSIADRP